eukprot:6302943-Ditylum_brightwellii.AAC.1
MLRKREEQRNKEGTIHEDHCHQMYTETLEWVDPEEKLDNGEELRPLSLEHFENINAYNKTAKKGNNKVHDTG